MHKILHFHDLRTYQAAMYSGFSALVQAGDPNTYWNIDHYESNKVCVADIPSQHKSEGIPFLEIALELQQQLPETKHCTMCAVQILVLLGVVHFPHMCSINTEKDDVSDMAIASGYLNDALEHLRNIGVIPFTGNSAMGINCATSLPYIFSNARPFIPVDYCLIAPILHYKGLILQYEHKYKETRNAVPFARARAKLGGM